MHALMKVLIAVADPAPRKLLTDILQTLSLEVVSAPTLEDARISVATLMPEVGIFDLALPAGQSDLLLREVRAARLPMAIALLGAPFDIRTVEDFHPGRPEILFARPLNSNAIVRWLQQQRQPAKSLRRTSPLAELASAI